MCPVGLLDVAGAEPFSGGQHSSEEERNASLFFLCLLCYCHVKALGQLATEQAC